jgi:hypothetical protein
MLTFIAAIDIIVQVPSFIVHLVSALLHFLLLFSRRSKIAIAQIVPQFVLIVSELLMLLLDRISVRVHIFVGLSEGERHRNART